MYAWLWGHLPGPLPLRLLIAVVGAAVVVVILFLVVFPWVDGRLNIDNGGVTQQSGAMTTDRTDHP